MFADVGSALSAKLRRYVYQVLRNTDFIHATSFGCNIVGPSVDGGVVTPIRAVVTANTRFKKF